MGGNWVAIGLRGADTQPDSPNLVQSGDVGASLLVKSGGAWQYFENGTFVSEGTVTGASSYDLTMTVIGSKLNAMIGATAVVTDRTIGGAGGTRTDNLYFCRCA